jgi:hypothetical protein
MPSNFGGHSVVIGAARVIGCARHWLRVIQLSFVYY